MSVPSNSMIAIDVGNSATKCGFFTCQSPPGLPVPSRVLRLPPSLDGFDQLLDTLPREPYDWWISSVQRGVLRDLLEQVSRSRQCDRITLLSHNHFPIRCDVDHPHEVGTDRLAAACATNHLRDPSGPAIVIDAGSATTVDLIDRDGVYQGGVILPGAGTMAAALADHADLLPRVDSWAGSAAPPAIGKNTQAAIQSGLFWGLIGAVKQVVEAVAKDLANRPQLFLSGGQAPHLESELPTALYVPHLVLSGIALCRIE